jgi:hypothetical protein
MAAPHMPLWLSIAALSTISIPALVVGAFGGLWWRVLRNLISRMAAGALLGAGPIFVMAILLQSFRYSHWWNDWSPFLLTAIIAGAVCGAIFDVLASSQPA